MKIINLTGDVGWEITANRLRAELNGVKEDVTLRVNSPGGYIFEGFELYNAIQDFQRDTGNKVTALINGLAASAASYFIMAADKITRRENSVFMGHKAWAIMWGNSDDLQHEASILEGIDGIVAAAYSKRTGEDKESILKKMKNEIWLFGEEIQNAGYADSNEPITETADEVEAYTPAEARARIAATKARVENFIKESEDMKNKAAAWIKNSIESVGSNSNTDENENKTKEEVSKMKIEEIIDFLKQNPGAMAQLEASEPYKAALETSIKNEGDRILKIVNLSGVLLSEEASEAIKNGTESGVFAETLLTIQNQKRQKENEVQNLGTLSAKNQTPSEQTQDNGIDEKKSGHVNSIKDVEELAKKEGGKK